MIDFFHNLVTYIYLTSLLVVSCLAVEPGQTPIDQTNLVSTPTQSNSPILRWIELHKQVYGDINPTSKIYSTRVKSNLAEMLSIEQIEANKIAIKSLFESQGYRVEHYNELVGKFHKASLLTKRDATITDILLQTFEYDSNNCNKMYFEHLDEICKIFEHKPVKIVLNENRDLQFRNCWHRLIDPVISTTMLIGLRFRSPLNKLVNIVYPNTSVILPSAVKPDTTTYYIESLWIAQKIALFLQTEPTLANPNNSMENYLADFQNLVKNPCITLINATKEIMKQTYDILELPGRKRDFINPIQTKILNRYIMCLKIVEDDTFISLNVVEFLQKSPISTQTNQMTTQSNQQSFTPIQRVLDFERAQREKMKKVDITKEFPAIKQTDDPNVKLITQQTPIEINDDLILTLQPKLTTSPTLDIEVQMGRKRPRIIPAATHSATCKNEYFADRPVGNHYVVDINCSFGKGALVKYETVWDDGTITAENREYLKNNWSSILTTFDKRRRAKNQARYTVRKLARSKTETELGQQDLGPPRTVVRIDCAIKNYNGPVTMYPTIWNDGTTSMERKEYLIENWPEAWEQYEQYTQIDEGQEEFDAILNSMNGQN